MNLWNHGLLTATALLTLALTAADTAPVESAAFESVELVDMPDAVADLTRWATDLFDAAGLELPPIRYTYHGDDRTGCGGRDGVHRFVDGHSTIHLCREGAGDVTAEKILHETAHAWAAWGLDDERKAGFQTLRGWSHWRNHDELRWHENGTEQAAEIIRWGLIDRPVRIVRINDNSCDALDAGYRVLTGQPPLHGYRDFC